MAPGTRRVGQSTRRMARSRRNVAIIIFLVAVAAVVGIALILQSRVLAGAGGATIALLILMLCIRVIAERGMDREFNAQSRAIRGAVGEELVGAILEQMGPDYLSIHDIESSYGNIDHIVIARQGGVFLIQTKSHDGRVDAPDGVLLVNGKPPDKDLIAQTLNNIYWLCDEINTVVSEKPWITPFLVFTNAFVPRITPIKGVRVLNMRFLTQELSASGRPSPANERLWQHRDTIASALRPPASSTMKSESGTRDEAQAR